MSKIILVKNYIFGLFNNKNELVDQTNLDENSEELAWDTFSQFAIYEGYEDMNDINSGYYVKLLTEEDEEVDEDDI